METFRLFFNRRRNWVCVYLHDVTPETFDRRGGGRWAYFVPPVEADGPGGLTGELHFVADRVRSDVVAHELIHTIAAWMRQRKMELNARNEERIATIMDELTRNFWREYERLF